MSESTGFELMTLPQFEGHNIRCALHNERMYYAVVDVLEALTDTSAPHQYWRDTKKRMAAEGDTQTQEKILHLKMEAADGKMRLTDMADTQTLLRIIQSVPSPKAEPFKLWLAQTGAERLDELADPAAAFEEWLERAIRSYMAHGFSEVYARNRIDSILARNRITGQWVLRGITEDEIPILTDRLHMGTFDISVDQHKGIKGFPEVVEHGIIRHKGNLRPALTPREMAVLTFAENITAAIHEERDSRGLSQITRDVDDGASIAREKRIEVERVIGTPVVSSRNMLKSPDGGIFGDLDGPDGPLKEGC